MPKSADDRGDRFARALDGGLDGLAPDGLAPDGLAPDGLAPDGLARDDELRRELALVGLLVQAGRQLGPDDDARDRMRRRIEAGLARPAGELAVVPIDVVAPVDEVAPTGLVTAAAGADSSPAADGVTPIDVAARRRRAAGRATSSAPSSAASRAAAGRQARQARLLAAAAVLFVLVLSVIGLVMSRDALPGDALYGVKRGAESAELGLTFGDEPRGFKLLRFATERVDEIEALGARAGATGSPGAAEGTDRYHIALQAFDSDAIGGARRLIDSAADTRGSELAALRSWAQRQRERLDWLRAGLPPDAAARLDGSLAMLDRIIQRVAALQGRLPCQDVTSDARDGIGLLPADSPCVPASKGPDEGQPGAGQPGVTPSGTNRPGPIQSALPTAGPSPSSRPGGSLPPLGSLLPGVPNPGTQSGGPPATGTTSTTQPLPNISLPLPLPTITLPPLLPGLPSIGVG